MAKYRYFICLLLITQLSTSCKATLSDTSPESGVSVTNNDQIVIGAAQKDRYLPLLSGKRVGVVANQTSLVEGVHLVDLLIQSGIKIERVFAPEHGFRGEAGPGDKVNSGKDPSTGLQVVSLYGSKKRPDPEEVKDLDVVVFDIQDVGTRFYTFISTLHYVMEVCAENQVEVMVLDRPNPNGFYIDGPVLKTEFSSFVGVAPIPVVHGLTVGEYAKMVNGEKWLRGKNQCTLTVISLKNYDHSMLYELPVRPSPNLPNMASVYLYPTLCFFEGAKVSVGRGTPYPFQVFGFPDYSAGTIVMTPEDIPGVITNTPYKGKQCRMVDLRKEHPTVLKEKRLMLEWIIEIYKAYPQQSEFFNNFFDKLAGTDSLRKAIIEGKSAQQIRAMWSEELNQYRSLRQKYLLYND